MLIKRLVSLQQRMCILHIIAILCTLDVLCGLTPQVNFQSEKSNSPSLTVLAPNVSEQATHNCTTTGTRIRKHSPVSKRHQYAQRSECPLCNTQFPITRGILLHTTSQQ